MTVEEQIKELNETVKCKLAPSKVHGVGVFSVRDIKKGERLHCKSFERMWFVVPYERFNEIKEEVKELILQRWPLVQQGNIFLSPNDDARLISFMNDGGEESNYDARTDKALRDIVKGEEVLEDYKKL